MAQKIGYLTGREGFDAAVRLFYSVDQRGGKGVAERVEPLSFQPCRLQNSVISFAKVHRVSTPT